jgi:protein-S-isoprenylcysteine O-methyltransferase Ste14
MSTLVEDPWPYLAFASLHLVAGQVVAGLVYRARFGRSPLVLYRGRAAAGAHGRRTRWVGLATLAWAAALLAFTFSPGFRASVVGMPLVALSPIAGWITGILGLVGMLAAQIGMGAAFRVGLDEGEAPRLVATGLHARSRNPVYVFSVLYLLGVSLWAPCAAVLVGLVAIAAGIHGLVLEEERFLAAALGPDFEAYRGRVRRYL